MSSNDKNIEKKIQKVREILDEITESGASDIGAYMCVCIPDESKENCYTHAYVAVNIDYVVAILKTLTEGILDGKNPLQRSIITHRIMSTILEILEKDEAKPDRAVTH